MAKGARFYRCDFQVHTPRDEQYQGEELITDEQKRAYSENFIKACRNKNLDAVAITDHHDMMFFRYIQWASKNEKDVDGAEVKEEDRIIVFPGMELTLQVPCQALILFDSDLDMNDVLCATIYGALKINDFTDNSSVKTAPVTQLPFKTINEVYDSLNSIDSLRGRFTIFPNIKDSGGDSILRQGFHKIYAEGVFDGGYLDINQYEKHKDKTGWNNVIEGKTEAYGYKSIGVFQTSDCRTQDFKNLGVSSTWVKWSKPSAEGLRQACLAKDSRISQTIPSYPQTLILKLEVKGSSFLKDIEIEFNSQFNVLIGGRGTGKSSVLQYLSWAMGKDSQSSKASELASFIKETLGDEGEVVLTVSKNGVIHQIKRSKNNYLLKIGDSDETPTTSQDIVNILQTESYSQKELSQHEKDRTSQLTQLIEYSINDQLKSIERKISENGDSIKEKVTKYESHVNHLNSIKSIDGQINSIKSQLDEISKGLEEVPEDDKQILSDNKLIQNEKELTSDILETQNDIKTELNQLLSSGLFQELKVDSTHYKHTQEINELLLERNKTFKEIEDGLNSLLSKVNPTSITELTSEINNKHQAFGSQYEEAKTRQQKFDSLIKKQEGLQNNLKVLNDEKQRVSKLADEGKGLAKEIIALYQERHNLNIKKWEAINIAKSDIISKSEGSIEIKMSPPHNINALVNKFLYEVTGSKGQPERTQEYFSVFRQGKKSYQKLRRLWLALYESTNKEELTASLEAKGIPNESLVDGDLERIIRSLDNNKIIELSLLLPQYELELEYKKSKDSLIPFANASYGQQAGAILTILLNQEIGPLIIDQPEDDLDNKVIQRITENINKAKNKRQLIFSSHNANIAVNGDAELIMSFEHDASKSSTSIVAQGSIDEDETKEQIMNIMEGGQKAFKMRKEKLGF